MAKKTNKRDKARQPEKKAAAEQSQIPGEKSLSESLKTQVENAQGLVDQLEAKVDALSGKLNQFQADLAVADGKQTSAKANHDRLSKILNEGEARLPNSRKTFNEAIAAQAASQKIAADLQDVMAKWGFSAIQIQNLYDLATELKNKNPLLSDNLMTSIVNAKTHADRAFKASLTTLSQAYQTQESVTEFASSSATTFAQVQLLLHSLDATDPPSNKRNTDEPSSGLKAQLFSALEKAKANYQQTLQATEKITSNLTIARKALKKAQEGLKSLKAQQKAQKDEK